MVEPRHPVFVALHDTIEKRGLTLPPFEDLLSAFRADLEVTRYATFASLRAYTARSAEPVGRLLLGLFGYHDPELVRFADEIFDGHPADQLLAGRGRRRCPRPHLHSWRGSALLRRQRG
jgi:phytoene/squalene synthetase